MLALLTMLAESFQLLGRLSLLFLLISALLTRVVTHMFRSNGLVLLLHGYTNTYEIITDNIYFTPKVGNALN
jgi:hypothetical protein